MLLVVAAAIGADLATRTQMSSLVAFASVGLTVAVLDGARLLSTRTARGLAAAALAVAALLPLRASTWLAHLNSWTIVMLLIASCLCSLGLPGWSTSSLAATLSRMMGARFGPVLAFQSSLPRHEGIRATIAPLLRGALIALFPIGVIIALLASADAVFAEALTPGLHLDRLVGHGIVAAIAAILIVALVCIARTPPPAEARHDWRPLGGVEALTVLSGLMFVYLLFAGAQLYSALGHADEILARQGVTPADYARSGFFQLLWVAGITAVLLGAMRLLLARRSQRVETALRACGCIVALLTVVIVAVAIVRLGLYTDRFGLTTLRWYSTAFAWLLGTAFILIAIASARGSIVGLGRALAALCLGAIIVVNALNPEARVAEHNLAHADTIELDARYLVRLSADAWPTILDNKATVVAALPGGRGPGFEAACSIADRPRGYGPLGFNLANFRLDCDDA